MVAAFQLQVLNVEEFLALELPDSHEYELRDGVIVPMAEPSGRHENLRSELMFVLKAESKRAELNLLIHPKPGLMLGAKDTRKPDLIAVDQEDWRRQTEVEAVLQEPPSIVIEIVSTNWEDDYRNKPLWYAAFGVPEYWIIDPLYHLVRYPNRKNPKIEEPTISVGTLQPSDSILVEREYRFKSFVGNDYVQSQFFSQLQITVNDIVAFG
ncbi:Uma2 family endonuclease [Leptolyngbya sp. NK1-12]|uniref:Uma2 family endonuclease n=1 Tax=Leptolyngbya sp. NK1-12 TaxID=2547451 RepID=A0AA97AI86_9CYAN|nr:Uma2 family endonuclease [Leptolyngbya sp. NK1-12]WNZ21647.1 Uma2 family endonuclease [Leptolyngbya sp. NK1-12]